MGKTLAVGALGLLLSVGCGKSSGASVAIPQPDEHMQTAGIGAGPTAVFEHEPSELRKTALADLEPVWVERSRIARMYVGKQAYTRRRDHDATGPATPANTHPIMIILGDRKGSSGPDADADGISDAAEVAIGTDPHKTDSDGDGLPDAFEAFGTCTHPAYADSDGDGTPDNEEIDIDDANSYLDTDQDGLLNGQEVAEFNSDPNKLDTDGDSFGDGAEYFFGTSMTEDDPNADGDGLPDDFEAANPSGGSDSDNDDLPDWIDPNDTSSAQVEGRRNAAVAANSIDCNPNSNGAGKF